MKEGDKIRIFGTMEGDIDLTVEKFRHCLGVFLNEDSRRIERFTPLCKLYGRGPESEDKYIDGCGEHVTNLVPLWGDVPRD